MALFRDRRWAASRASVPGLLVLLLLVVAGSYCGRALFIGFWFVQGAPQAPAASVHQRVAGPVRPVRVVLIDGLSERVARTLLTVSQICETGLTLRVQVGWPSVSLPVQHVLWTGTWQNQSGVMFQIRRLAHPVFDSLPARVAARSGNAVAIAEAQPFIVTSFPFSQVIAPEPGQKMLTELDLQQASLQAYRSGAALVFVHLLGVDEAGHRVGSAGARYLEEARRADRLLRLLWQVHRPDQTLLVLSDHGHLTGSTGGHGGREPGVATVRACLAGPGVQPQPGELRVQLPDLTTILAQQLNVPPPRYTQGRTLEQVLAGAPDHPWRSDWGLRLGLFAGITLLGWAVLVWSRGLLVLPWPMAASVLLLVLVHGAPTLSRFYVYRSLPLALIPVTLPALLGGLQLWWIARRGVSPTRATLLLLLSGLLPVAAALVVSGWPFFTPPLVPHLSAWASTLSWLGVGGGLGLLVGFVVVRLSARWSRFRAGPALAPPGRPGVRSCGARRPHASPRPGGSPWA